MAKVDEWLEQDKLILLEGWARDGLTNEQIAKNVGINPKTLYDWMNKKELIREALKKGKEIVDFEVENALYKRALGYTITINEQKLDKDGCVHDLKREVHIPGDTVAQIFWLKNRKTKQWKDKVETSVDTTELTNVEKLLNKIEDEANK